MKDQYVGDLNDFEKYALLRVLGPVSGLPLLVCWMLTPPDGRGDGGNLAYLNQPRRFRHLDPELFDQLNAIVSAGDRRVGAVGEAQLLPRATFFSPRLEDARQSRILYFREFWATAPEEGLVFFDPDIGLERSNLAPGHAGSSMYLFLGEVTDAYRRGHSLVIYQHFPREQRESYLARTFERLSDATGQAALFAVASSRVAFLVIPQPEHVGDLARAAEGHAVRWELKYWDARDLTALRAEIVLRVPGYPPTKNEAKSLLSNPPRSTARPRRTRPDIAIR